VGRRSFPGRKTYCGIARSRGLGGEESASSPCRGKDQDIGASQQNFRPKQSSGCWRCGSIPKAGQSGGAGQRWAVERSSMGVVVSDRSMFSSWNHRPDRVNKK